MKGFRANYLRDRLESSSSTGWAICLISVSSGRCPVSVFALFSREDTIISSRSLFPLFNRTDSKSLPLLECTTPEESTKYYKPIKVNILKFRTLLACHKGIDKQLRPRLDLSSLIRMFPVCYSDKWSVNSSPDNHLFIWEEIKIKCSKF